MSAVSTIQPAFPRNSVAIAYAVDCAYLPYCAVTLQSVIEHVSPHCWYDIVILTTGVTDSHRLHMLSLIPEGSCNISLRFYDMSPLLQDEKNIPIADLIAKPTYYRLYIPQIFREYERVVYMDVDMIAMTDVAALHEVDLKGNWCGAVVDYPVTSRLNAGRNTAEYFVKTCGIEDPASDYFNAGLMIFDIKTCIENRIVEQCIEILFTRPQLKWMDQDILNKVCHGHVHYLPLVWNVMRRESYHHLMREDYYHEWQKARKQPYINHYAGNPKPWKSPAHDEYHMAWWNVARKTPYYEELVYNNLKAYATEEAKKKAAEQERVLKTKCSELEKKLEASQKTADELAEDIMQLRADLKAMKECAENQRKAALKQQNANNDLLKSRSESAAL